MPVDPDVANLLALIAAAGHPPVAEGTVAEARQGIETLMVGLRDPARLATVRTVSDGMVAGSVPVRVYRPDVNGPAPTLVYYHGGGFVIGNLETHDGVCRALCHDTGAVVVNVDYRLAPEHHFPAAVEDAYAALRWVAAHIDEYGGDPNRLAVGGDSAGGNLAAVSAQQARRDGIRLAAQLLVYPNTDLLGEYPSRTANAEGYFMTLADARWFAEQYIGMSEDDPRVAELARDPRLSPLLAESLDGLPPAVIATAEFDVLRDEGNAYAAALEKAGVRVEHREFAGLVHGFYGLEQFSPAIAAASAWIGATLRDVLA